MLHITEPVDDTRIVFYESSMFVCLIDMHPSLWHDPRNYALPNNSVRKNDIWNKKIVTFIWVRNSM